MSKIGMQNLNGLAMGQGPVTFSTSPLWSPYGPYSMNPNQFGGFYGEADGASQEEAQANGEQDQGMLANLMSNKVTILGFGIPTVLLAGLAGYYLFFSQKAPLRRNAWKGDKEAHADAASIRWAKKKGTSKGKKKVDYEKKLAKRAGLTLARWRMRRSSGAKGYARYYLQQAKKAAKASSAKKYEMKKVGSQTHYFVDGKRVLTKKQTKTQKKVFKEMKDAGTKTLSANPRRRKNAIKTNPKRRKNAVKINRKRNALKMNRKRNALKINRKRNGLSMKKNSAAQRRAQRDASKAMKLWRSGKARSLKAAWKMV